MGYVHDEIDSAIGKRWRIVLTVIAVLIAGYFIIALVGSFWPFSVARDVVNKVTNAEYIISNYEWFYDMKGQIEATKAKAKIAKGTPEEKGIQMVAESMIQEYNARSRMTTRTLWKADDLPYQIESGVE